MKKNVATVVAMVSVFLLLALFLKARGNGEPANPQENVTGLAGIRMAYPSAGTMISGQVGLTLQKTDILKENGLDAVITPMSTGKEMKTALTADQVDVILTSESNFLVLLGSGFECYGVASLGSDGKMALVVDKNSPIGSVADLRGGKVATLFGTSVHKPAVEWVKDAGLTPGEDVEVVNIGSGSALRSALASNSVDAIVDWDPYLTSGINGGSYKVLAESDLDLIAVMSKQYADQNPESIARFRNSLREVAFYMSQNKGEVAGWYGEMSQMDPNLTMQVSGRNSNYNAASIEDVDVSISEAFTEKLVGIGDFLYTEGLIENRPDVRANIKQQ